MKKKFVKSKKKNIFVFLTIYLQYPNRKSQNFKLQLFIFFNGSNRDLYFLFIFIQENKSKEIRRRCFFFKEIFSRQKKDTMFSKKFNETDQDVEIFNQLIPELYSISSFIFQRKFNLFNKFCFVVPLFALLLIDYSSFIS